jgi:uncharacterized protein (DUF927 family)
MTNLKTLASVTEILLINLTEAERFLTSLGGKDAQHVFQTFCNNSSNEGAEPKIKREGIKPNVLVGSLSQYAKQLELINKSESGVFVVINETNGGRKASDVIRVRALFADWDNVGTGLPAIAACAIKPHIVVESSPGKFHAYWLVSDCGLDDFTPLQKAIAVKLGSDPAINNKDRVMRLPGYFHHKYADNLYFQTRIIEINENTAYTVEEIKQGLGLNLNPASKMLPSTTYDNNSLSNININKIKSALAIFPIEFIDDRDSWLRIGMCLHSHSTDLIQVWLDWSKASSKFEEASAVYTWSSFGNKDSAISIASLFYEAKKLGWFDDSKPSKFEVRDDGVYFNGVDKEGQPLSPELVCSKLEVLGTTSGANKQDWGRYLAFPDRSGFIHHWAMPMSMMAAEGAEYRAELLRLGLEIAANSKAKTRLADYITSSIVTKHFTAVEKTGWYKKSFILPHATIGVDEVLFQSTGGLSHAYANKGPSKLWQDNVAKLCTDNSRLVFAASSAFAAPLLNLVGLESGGFHFRGDSSSGKTTALRVAASVWGGLDYLQRWRATSNGLEGLAALYNDGLLVLDELSQCDPKEAGNIAYMLANGTGKVRAGKSGAARASLSWRLLFLSAGEISLGQHMLVAGQRSRAGQEIRLIDIPADAGKGLGLFDTTHDTNGGAAFSKLLVDNCTKYHGRVGREFLDMLCASLDNGNDSESLKFAVRKMMEKISPVGASGQVLRGVERFALVAVAGELATKFGLTGWQTGESETAARGCFNAWLDSRGGSGNQEITAILSQVKAFFELHGESRFSPVDRADERVTHNRAGFSECIDVSGSSTTLYYCLAEVYKNDICRGYDSKQVSKVLKEAGWLQTGNDGKSAQAKRLRGMGNTRYYWIRPLD